MFRDLKEYQEIAKIYADKVSKPENLEERRGSSSAQLAQNRDDAFKGVPNSASNKRAEMSKARRGDKKFVFNKPTSASNKRAEMSIKRRDQSVVANKSKVVPGTRVNEIGAEGGGKPSSGDLSMFKDKKPEVSTMTKQGKPRTKAQMMAAKRIASGKTIADVKQSNQDAMRARAKAKFEAFKKRRAEKKLDKQRDFDDPNKRMNRGESYIPDSNIDEKMNINPGSGRDTVNEPGVLKVYRNVRTVGNLIPNIGKALAGDKKAFKNMEKKEVERYKNPKGIERVATGIADKLTGDKFDFDMRGKSKTKKEEFTPYDIVLEYLLSTEQVATIEEANYVMTEMDGKTINDIVEMQGQVNRADIIGGTQAAKNAAAGKGKYTPGKGVTKDFKLDPSFKLPKA